MRCECECGAVHFDVPDKPLFRALCHCSICQKFNDAPQADVVVYCLGDVELPSAGTVVYGKYRPPPNVRRGKCAGCGRPAIEVFESPLLPKIVMVPRRMFGESCDLPEPVQRIFYETRVGDESDEIPRYSGYLRSQFAFLNQLRRSLRDRKNNAAVGG